MPYQGNILILTKPDFVKGSPSRDESRLGDVQSLADHETSVQDEHASDRVEFKHSTLSHRSERDIVQDPALLDPVGHDGRHSQRRRNRSSLEVL